MKILVACVNMIPRNTRRQPWFYIDTIAQVLSEQGHDVWILTDKNAEWPKDRKVIVSKNFRSFPKGIDDQVGIFVERQGFDAVIWPTGLTDFLFKNKIDVLKIPVIAVVTSPRYFLGELLSLGKDLVLNLEFTKQFFLGPFISQRRIKDFLKIPNLKAIVFESEETLKRYVPDGVDKNKIFVISPPLPKDFLNALEQFKGERIAGEKKHFKLLYFGPSITLRGIDTLIHAMAVISKKIGNLRLTILSRTEHDGLAKYERRMLKLIRRNRLDSKIDIVSGLLTPAEIIKHIFSADIVCLPFKCVVSDVPIAVLETLATGIPLITTEMAGVSEFIKDGNCFLIPPRDHEALAGAAVRILRSNTQKIKEFDRERFLIKHGLKNFNSSFKDILKKIGLKT